MERMNAGKYREFEKNLLQNAHNLRQRWQFTFEHNNDPKQAVRTMDWFQDKSLTILEWPKDHETYVEKPEKGS